MYKLLQPLILSFLAGGTECGNKYYRLILSQCQSSLLPATANSKELTQELNAEALFRESAI